MDGAQQAGCDSGHRSVISGEWGAEWDTLKGATGASCHAASIMTSHSSRSTWKLSAEHSTPWAKEVCTTRKSYLGDDVARSYLAMTPVGKGTCNLKAMWIIKRQFRSWITKRSSVFFLWEWCFDGHSRLELSRSLKMNRHVMAFSSWSPASESFNTSNQTLWVWIALKSRC